MKSCGVWALGILILCTQSLAASPEDKISQAIRSSGISGNDLGIWVEGLYAKNAEKPFVPASLSKLITLGAVIHLLPPDRKFQTELLSDGAVDNGILKGSLYLRGGGDPSFTSENMWVLVDNFTRQGITQIAGDLVVDDSLFDAVRFGEERESTRVDRAYDAPVGAMSFNWNSVNVFVRPGRKPGEPAGVVADPVNSYIRVRNEARTVSGSGKNIVVERREEKDFSGDIIVVSGTIGREHEEAVVYKSISKPDFWSGYSLLEFLRQRGIGVAGGVRAAKAPENANVLASIDSKSLSSIFADMAKYSNNYIAEMLVKDLAAEKGSKPATLAAGMGQIRKYLAAHPAFSKQSYAFESPSGFNRDNRLTPEQIGNFLKSMRSDFSTFPEFLVALPIAGIDGTLKKRMRNSPAERWVRAKTGLLNGAVGLAGYVGHPDGRVQAFAFIYNGNGHEENARELFDKIAAILAS
ncbi:MAG: D-alanyl-D-alanine carboxypeptidase/D-alanyl-D-alanine-endopeptidase [Oligoflexia bacterium]|nr:D-alanyl-D-alanine carboxypeptidase/D-alanyl-D-alanine-endopeptidase [Oligoflexia bacterium]